MNLLDEQLERLRPLTDGAIGALAGHTNGGSIAVKKRRGSPLSAKQLRTIAERLRDKAEVAEQMAEQT